MVQWLQDSAIYLWILDFFVWCTFFWFSIKDKRVSSSLIAITVVLVIDGVMTNYGNLIAEFFDSGYTQTVRVVYYGGYVLFDTLAIWVIFKVHKIVGLDYRVIARTYLLAYFVLAWIQLIRLAERLYFDSNSLKLAYSISVAAINTGTAIISCSVALVTIYLHLTRKHIGGSVWKV